eukprot:909574_1
MGNKIPEPILEKEEALSRWNPNDLEQLQRTFETYARMQSKDKMSKSAFQNYAFPFLPKELIERLFVVFQLQVIDDTLKSNYKRNAKVGTKYRTNAPNALTANLKNPDQNDEQKGTPSSVTKTKQKTKKMPSPKVGIPPFLSFTVNLDQFVIGMTIMKHGTDKEKLLLLWRMFDIQYTNNLSYYDMQHILDILLQLETNFFDKTSDEILYDLFTFQMPSEEDASNGNLSPLTKINELSDLDEKEDKKSDKEDAEEEEKVEIQSHEFDINQLMECKMEDVAKKDTSNTDSKMDEKAELLKSDKMSSTGSIDRKMDTAQSVDELEELQQKKMCFEHFYEWCKQYGHDTNPFSAWLCGPSFPPPAIEAIPETFVALWKDVYGDKDSKALHEQYGYLCTDCNEIYGVADSSKFSASEVMNIYSAWYNTEAIYQYNCGYFLTFEQFSTVLEMYIIDKSYMEIVFQVMDRDHDGNITVEDMIHTLSILMKRVHDEDQIQAMADAFNQYTSDDEQSMERVFDGLLQYVVIEFGIHPLPPQISLELDIISSLLNEYNHELQQYKEPVFEEYGDHYYLISTQWWTKWCHKQHIKATYLSDGRVATLTQTESDDDAHKEQSLLGPIDNRCLLLKYANDEYILKPDLVACDDYIGIIPSIWSVLLKWYHGGPGIRRSIIGNYDETTNKHIPCLEIYPLRIYIHSKTSPELLDNQRQILENLKLERDYKAAEETGNATAATIAKELQTQSASQKRKSRSIFDQIYRQKSVQIMGSSLDGIYTKIDHLYNGNHYQWDLLVSKHTSLDFIKQILLKYDPLLVSMQASDAEYTMDGDKMRFWWLHNERSLVIQQHKGMKIKILNTSPSYEQFVKMKKKANGKLTQCFQSDPKKKKKKKKKKKSNVSPVPKSKPPVLFEGNEVIEHTDLSHNCY